MYKKNVTILGYLRNIIHIGNCPDMIICQSYSDFNHEYTIEKIEILCTIGDGLQNPTKYKLNKKAITKIPNCF